MTTAHALADHINSVLASPIIPNRIDSNAESLVIVHQTSSIRILLVRNRSKPDVFSLEVEVYLPSKTDSASNSTESELLDCMITNLHYIQGLRDIGFSIEVIGTDCMWSAFKDFKQCPKDEVLDLLVPPTE